MANGSSSLRGGNNSSVPLVVIVEEAPVMWKEKRRYKNKKKKGGGDDKEDGSVVKFTVPVKGGEDTTSDRYCVYISVMDFPGLYPEAWCIWRREFDNLFLAKGDITPAQRIAMIQGCTTGKMNTLLIESTNKHNKEARQKKAKAINKSRKKNGSPG